MEETYLVALLVKLAAVASIASILARSAQFKAALMRESRTLNQRLTLSLWLSVVFAGSVAVRAIGHASYDAADLGLEGSLLAGLIGGYVTGLTSGVIIALPAVYHGERLTLELLAGVGVLGGLLRDCAPDPEEIWRFSPFFDLNIYRFFKERKNYHRTAFHLLLFAAVLFAEFLRHTFARFSKEVYLMPISGSRPWIAETAFYTATLFAVAIPLKIWSSARNEKKLEERERLLAEARLAALTHQINPHFLFNTLNSVSSLIRTNPDQARLMVVKLSKVLRRLLRRYENFSSLREELSFTEDYLSIEMMRFGDKLRFERDVDEAALDMLVPSMLLQPLVENSIKHGINAKLEGGTVRITARRDQTRLLLTVEDDGVGIPEEKLATMLERGVGMNNVNERLKVLFGDGYKMWIESQPGQGTHIQIEVPELHSAAPHQIN